MSATGGILPTYQRFVNGVPVPSFSRRSFRPREKYLIFLVFLTFGLVCFGTFFFLPEFRGSNSTVDSVYKVYQHMQKAGPELLIPAPPHLSDSSDSLKLIRHDDEKLDPHVIDDRAKLLAKIEQDSELKVLERPNMDLNMKKQSSTSTVSRPAEEVLREASEHDTGGLVPQVAPVVTIPPAHSDHYPETNRGEDKDPVARERRAKVKEVTVDSMVKPLLKWLNVVGCNPHNSSINGLIKWFFWTLFTFTFAMLIFIRTVLFLKSGISLESVENVLNLFLFFQFVFKYFFYRIKAKYLKELFNTTYEKFWTTDFIPEESQKFNYMYYIIFKIMDIYRKSYIFMNAVYTAEPLFYRKGLLRIPIWLPNYDELITKSPYYEFIYIYEAVITLSADFVMLNFELMCLYFLGTCYVQIEMIKTKFLRIGDDNFTEETLKECVKHHDLILNHLNCIVSTLSMTMLQQVVTYFMAICLPVFLFTSTGDVTIGFCICSVINLINFYLYCLIGQYLYDQCLSISDAISDSDWWKVNKSIRHSLLIVMERSSKGLKLTAGGLLDLTLSTFLEVKSEFLLTRSSLRKLSVAGSENAALHVAVSLVY